MSDLATVFTQAAALLEPEGAWCQRVFGVRDGRAIRDDNTKGCQQRCLVGAVREVCESSKRTRKLRAPAERALAAALPCAPMNWNDQPERTQDEVVAVLYALAVVTPVLLSEGADNA